MTYIQKTKLIPGWPLSHYGVHDKSIIFVEKFEVQQEDDYFVFKIRYLALIRWIERKELHRKRRLFCKTRIVE